MSSIVGMVLGCLAVFFIWLHARKQPALDEATRKDYSGTLVLNFLFCLASNFFYDYARFNYSTWSVTREPQDYSLFYRLGVTRGDWLAIAASKYFVCSLLATALFLLISLLNYALFSRSKIGQAKQRAIYAALTCTICFLTASAYGCYMFYLEQIKQ